MAYRRIAMNTPDHTDPASQVKPQERELVGLNFKVPRGLRASFRQAAAARDCSMVELLRDCFQAWQEREGLNSPASGGRKQA